MNTSEAIRILDRIVTADKIGNITLASYGAAEAVRFRFYRARNNIRKQLATIDGISVDEVCSDYDHLAFTIEDNEDGTATLIILPNQQIELELMEGP